MRGGPGIGRRCRGDAWGGRKKAVLDNTGGVGADVVIECVGAMPVLAEAMDLARLGGRLVSLCHLSLGKG